MAIKIPQNQIQYKYTSGKEYMELSTYREYQGYYYELKGKVYAGKEFNSNAPELIPIPKDNTNTSSKFNSLLTRASTYVYGRISGAKIPNTTISSLPEGGNFNIQHSHVDEEGKDAFFYCKKINDNSIKKISKDTYLSLLKNPLYQTTYIGIYNNKEQTIEEAEKQVPGVTDWVVSDTRGF